jgi:hypothetical protein
VNERTAQFLLKLRRFALPLRNVTKGVMDMRMKIALSTAALILLPALGMAEGCRKDTQAMSCATGTTYDADSHSCIATTT